MNIEPAREHYDVIIIGGGPAGASAAIYTARAGLKTLVIDKGITAGALGITSKIANFPGIPGEISGYELVERIREQASTFGAEFKADRIQGVDLGGEVKSVFGSSQTFSGRTVILATGSMGRTRKVSGEDTLLGRGVSYCATCDAAFFRGQPVAVAGNSDEALSEALHLASYASHVYLLSPTPDLKAPEDLLSLVSSDPKISLTMGASVREVIGSIKVEGIRFGIRGKGEQTIKVKGVFLYLQGAQPVTDFLMGQVEICEGGYLKVDHQFQTSLPGVFAVGDVICDHIKQAVIAASEGASAAIAVEKLLRSREQLKMDWG